MKLNYLILLLLVTAVSCSSSQRRPVQSPSSAGSASVGVKPPEEPVLNLAYRAAMQIQSGLTQAAMPMQLRMAPLENSAALAPGAVDYFQSVLMTRLQVFGMSMPGDAPTQLQGSLYWLRDQLVYGFKLRKGDQTIFSDSVAISHDERLENTLAQFATPEGHHHGHPEALIPTPVAQLKEAPLDVGQFCSSDSPACEITLLYSDRIEFLNWKTLARRVKNIPPAFFSPTRSRAPSGKILQTNAGFVVVNNNLSAPLNFDAQFNGPGPPVANAALPVATPGYNTYALGDGKFSDFEILTDGGMAVVDPNHHLSVAREGALNTAANPAGGALAVNGRHIYTSAATLPGQPDSVQRFTFQDGAVTFDSSRPALGAIVDVAVTDLNKDGIPELLVTVQRPEGVFIEVWEPF